MDTGTSPLLTRDGEKPPLSFSGFGLHCVRPTASEKCVVFVHGILSSGETAWGSPSWPELLKAEPELMHAGIFVFTYRTSLSSRTYSIADAADALREAFFSIDGLWKVPNIVFVCHSMGGIVVRRFLVANQAQLLDLRPTIGLFLVASPSLGARDANILSTLSFALQHTQASALRFSQGNTSLDELHRDFKTLLNGGKLCIVGRELLEDRPIKVKRWLGLWRQVVEPFSASAYFHQPGCEPLRIPDSDHESIVKPLQPKALQHVTLTRFLRELQKLADEKGRLDSQSPRPDKDKTQVAPTTNIELGDRRRKPDTNPHSVPVFRLRANGFEGGDDAALEHVITALEIAKQSDHDCFCLVLPEADENEETIAQLKSIPNRNEAERSELVTRIGSKKRNDGIHVKLCKAFRVVLQDPMFRKSAGLRDDNPENTWEILVHMRRQLFRQIAFEDRKVVYASTTATERIYGDVLLTRAEFESENTRYFLDDVYPRRQGMFVGERYVLDAFTPSFVRQTCLPTIALLLADPDDTQVPRAVRDVRTWRLSIDQPTPDHVDCPPGISKDDYPRRSR
jgi:pimeloyl-ACP methyl ester carboxylesterase